jgi:hypothetical protein
MSKPITKINAVSCGNQVKDHRIKMCTQFFCKPEVAVERRLNIEVKQRPQWHYDNQRNKVGNKLQDWRIKPVCISSIQIETRQCYQQDKYRQ